MESNHSDKKQSRINCLHENIIEAISNPIFFRDIDGHFTGCNKAFERFSGIDGDSLLNKTLYDIFPKEKADAYSKLDEILIKSHRDQHCETIIEQFGGIKQHVIINKSVHRDINGHVTGSVGVIIDISKQRELENKLNEINLELELDHELLWRLGYGIVIFNKSLKIINANKSFASIFGPETEVLFETAPNLKNIDIKKVVPFHKIFEAFVNSGEKVFVKDMDFKNKMLQITIIGLEKHKISGAIIKDLSIPELRSEELIRRAKEVKKGNLDAVQKIAYILGENASKTEQVLNSIVEFHKFDGK